MPRAPARSRNPRLSLDEAMVVVRDLLVDPDPVSLDVVLDTLEEAGLNLVEISEAFYREDPQWAIESHGLSTKGDIGSRGLFVLSETGVGDTTDCVWSVERDFGRGAGENWRVLLNGRFHDRKWTYEVSRRYKDIEFALDRAITDAWFCVNVMRLRYIATAKRISQVVNILEAAAHGDYDEYTIEKMYGADVWRRKPMIHGQSTVNPSKKKRSVGVAGTGVFGFAGDLLGAAVNPSMTADEAFVAFKDLIRDPDPAAMQIAEDLALEHKLSLVDLSSWGEHGGQFSLGLRDPADAPVYRVDWRVEPVYPTAHYGTKVHYGIGLSYVWNNQREDLHVPSGAGSYLTTLMGARRTAAADAWAIAKRMKQLMAAGRADEQPRPKFTTQDLTIQQLLMDAWTHGGDTTAPELYEQRSTRGRKKQPTYLEARDDIRAALDRAGWHLSPTALRTAYATSPNGRLRLWFKPQAVHYTVGLNHTQGNARSVDYDLDIRKITPTEFLDLVKRKFPGGFR